MASLHFQNVIENVGGGTFTVRTQLVNVSTGQVIDEATSEPVVVDATEVMEPNVLTPVVHVRYRQERGKKFR